MLYKFLEKYVELDPTIITGWNIEGFDTDSGFESLSSAVSNSSQVDESHNDIFNMSMREALA